MHFRPCIDIHNGKVKQIIGGSLTDADNYVVENFVSKQDANYFAVIYKESGLLGGHIIMLNPVSSKYYEVTKEAALKALGAYPQGMQIGGGITLANAKEFLDAGASHVIVTSYVFSDGKINYQRLEGLKSTIGKEHLVLDLSCRKKGNDYYIVTDRWQKFTEVKVTKETLEKLAMYCDEFLVHAVDVEGKQSGIESDLVAILAQYDGLKVTYAGGISSLADIELLKDIGRNKIDVTIGSALDLFGGTIGYQEVQNFCK